MDLGNFARLVAHFATKAIKVSQKLKADVAISPTLQSKIDLGTKGKLNS